MNRRQLQAYVETDLDIAHERRRRLASRRRWAVANLLAFHRLVHLLNKVLVNVQINGVAEFFRKFVYINSTRMVVGV